MNMKKREELVKSLGYEIELNKDIEITCPYCKGVGGTFNELKRDQGDEEEPQFIDCQYCKCTGVI